MPATLQTPKGTRCIRCATLIRNSRKNCPSCDLDLTNSSPSPNGSKSKVASRVGTGINPVAKAKGAPGESGRVKARAARASMKLCPVCMSSVAESEMSESAGQMVCNPCAVKLKNKPARPAPGAPGIAASSSAPPQISRPEPGARPASNNGLPAKPIMSDDELLTAKGMQRQLMDKLFWIKVLVIIWGVVSIISGGVGYLGAALGGAAVSVYENHQADDESFRDENGKKMSAAKIAEERERSGKIIEEGRSALFMLRFAAMFDMFVGVAFFASFFLMNKKPFEACTAVMIMYSISKILTFAFGGFASFGLIGIFVTISIMSTLAEGIRTGLRIKDIRERAEAVTGRPMVA